MATYDYYQLRLNNFGVCYGDDLVTYQAYRTLDGQTKMLISRIGDGRVIKRFDQTGTVVSGEDIVCPHFLELKWAYGCPLQCAYCYLQGTLRFMPDKKNPQNRPFKEIKDAVKKFKNEAKCPEILNSGELADSLMWEKSERSLSKIVIPMFRGTPHKVLVVTKLDLVDNLLDIDDDLKKNVIASFSINSEQVAKRWEVGAPEPARRVEAAGRLYDAGFEVRVRLDPVVAYPESGWLDSYVALIDRIFARLKPERVTVGSLRGLVSTINNSRDRSWTEYLTERSKWGRRIQFEQRFEIFSAILEHIQNQHNYNNLALCKEPVSMWDALGMDWKHCRCNCTW